MIQPGLGIKEDPISKITKPKRAGMAGIWFK
jgi:hypothetical protein